LNGRGGVVDCSEPDFSDRNVENPVLEREVVEGGTLEVESVLETKVSRALFRLGDEVGVGIQARRVNALVGREERRGQTTPAGRIEHVLTGPHLSEACDLAVQILAPGREDRFWAEADQIEGGGNAPASRRRSAGHGQPGAILRRGGWHLESICLYRRAAPAFGPAIIALRRRASAYPVILRRA